MSDYKERLQEAKRRLPISELWGRLGMTGKVPTATGFVVCPFHREKSGSFHVFDEGRMFKCFGCGVTGDAIIFLEKACGLTRKDACNKIIEMAGCQSIKPSVTATPKQTIVRSTSIFHRRAKPDVPTKTPGSPYQRKRLAMLRGLPLDAVELAVELGFLGFCEWSGMEAWIISDSTGANAQARRLDGGQFMTQSGPKKAKTLPGSWAKWPIGLPAKCNRILFAEGGPDLLAACSVALEVGNLSPACMFGAALEIHPYAIPLFTNASVFIVPHNDEAGEKASAMWQAQLAKVAKVAISKLPPEFKDLNDLMKLPSDERTWRPF